MSHTPMTVHDPAGARARTHAKYPTWEEVPPLPDVSLLDTIGASSLENFYLAGEAVAHIVNRRLPHGGLALDMGCGCGRNARFLLIRPDISYIGFDIFKPAIEWARQYLSPLAPARFRFEHFDAYSAHYNPRGGMKTADVSFPAGDGAIDVAFAASLFTHLLEPDARHYLRESARCLAPTGQLVASIHNEPAAGNRYSGNEDRIDVDKDYFIAMAAEAGLAMRENLGTICGQEMLVFGPIQPRR